VTTRDNLETRKKQGSYYTPQVLVRYLVDHSLGRTLYGTADGLPDGEPLEGEARRTYDQIGDLRVLDAACGSGSFLIYAYEVLAGFYEREIALREKYRYPPFVKLALVRLSFPQEWEAGGETLAALGRALREAGRELKVTVLGPAPAPLSLLRGRKRYHCLLKAADWQSLRSLFGRVARENPAPRQVRLELDLDPVNML
jgi:SAM-dependent methyltransferase